MILLSKFRGLRVMKKFVLFHRVKLQKKLLTVKRTVTLAEPEMRFGAGTSPINAFVPQGLLTLVWVNKFKQNHAKYTNSFHWQAKSGTIVRKPSKADARAQIPMRFVKGKIWWTVNASASKITSDMIMIVNWSQVSIYKYLALFDVDARRLTVVKFWVVRNSKFLTGYFETETTCNFS